MWSDYAWSQRSWIEGKWILNAWSLYIFDWLYVSFFVFHWPCASLFTEWLRSQSRFFLLFCCLLCLFSSYFIVLLIQSPVLCLYGEEYITEVSAIFCYRFKSERLFVCNLWLGREKWWGEPFKEEHTMKSGLWRWLQSVCGTCDALNANV